MEISMPFYISTIPAQEASKVYFLQRHNTSKVQSKHPDFLRHLFVRTKQDYYLCFKEQPVVI